MNAKVTLEPTALYRVDGFVIMWLDSPKGWSLLTRFGTLDADRKRYCAEGIVSAYMVMGDGGNIVAETGELASGMVVYEMTRLNLPPDVPDRALVGIHPSLQDDVTPVYVPGEHL